MSFIPGSAQAKKDALLLRELVKTLIETQRISNQQMALITGLEFDENLEQE